MSLIPPEIITWAEKQVETFSNRHAFYETYADTLEKVLFQVARKYAPESLVQARAKEVSSFAGKIWRKKDESNDPVNQFTDLCGGRVITNNQEGVKAICAYIESHFDIDWENSVDISQRLKPSEFGYRSVHYIVRFKRGVFPNDLVDVEIPHILYPGPGHEYQLKAEIQVRTILEHSWADFSHRISYKRPFKMPPKWEREMAKMAAFLEEADSQLISIQKGLKHYLGCYGAYMDEKQMTQEMEILQNVLRHDKTNAVLADEVARLAITLQKWDEAIQVLKPFEHGHYLPAIMNLGNAICNQSYPSRNTPVGKSRYKEGQELIASVLKKDPKNVAAICMLAGTYRDLNELKARELYQQAFEIEPDNPLVLSYYLDYTIIDQHDLSHAQLIQAIIRRAYKKSRELADARLELPWSYFNMGKFSLYLKDPYDALNMYTKGCQVSTNPWQILLTLQSLKKIEQYQDKIPGYNSIVRFLILFLIVKYPEEAKDMELLLKQKEGEKNKPPVVIVAGGTSDAINQEKEKYSNLLLEGVHDFEGILISGGTKAGICEIVGDIQEFHKDTINTIGYLPKFLPSHVERDNRYLEFRYSEGEHFSPLEALLYWEDLISTGYNPKDVKLIGINGGKISAAEYRIALALGATVGIVSESGKEATKILLDPDRKDTSNLFPLPRDPQTIRAFFGSSQLNNLESVREKLARLIHQQYQQMMREQVKEDKSKSNLFDWDTLPDTFKNSNLQQADHLEIKLKAIGYCIRKPEGTEPKIITFSDEEVECLAEMEHGRWNVERLIDGWRYGKEKDLIKKISPYLLPWDQLTETVKGYDRDTVRKIPENLAKIGLELVKNDLVS